MAAASAEEQKTKDAKVSSLGVAEANSHSPRPTGMYARPLRKLARAQCSSSTTSALGHPTDAQRHDLLEVFEDR